MSARITVPIGDVAGVVREALRAALDTRDLTLSCGETGPLDYEDVQHALHELGKVAARAVASLDVDKLAPGEMPTDVTASDIRRALALPLPDETCTECGQRLMFSARQRGDGLCGNHHREALIKAERAERQDIEASMLAEAARR